MLGNAELAQRGYNVGIQNCIHTESGYHGRASAKMVATTFEALIGAVYMDGGEEALLPVVEHLDLNQHPLLMVTSNLLLHSCGAEILRLTNMHSSRSLT